MNPRIGRLHAALACTIVIASATLGGCEGMKSGPGSKPSGPPKITIVGGDSIAWGRVAPGNLTYDLKIVNTGGDTLRLTDVHPSCGCTTAPLDKRNLGPGDTSTVRVTMDVTSRSGEQHKTLTITSNDSTRKALVLPLTAFVVRELELEPQFFPVLDSARIGVERGTTVVVKNTGTSAVTLQPATIPVAPEMLVRFEPSAPRQLAPGDTVSFTAFVKPIKEGTASAEVVINTDNKNTPVLKATITCNVYKK